MASELHPFIRGFGPVSTTVDREVLGASEQSSYATGFTFNAGAEFLAGTTFSPFYFGAGAGLMSAMKDHDLEIAPWSVPIWGSISLRSSKSYENLVPFVTARGGWMMPLSTSGAWWNSPKNFIVDASIGAIYQKTVGIELSYTFTSLEKSYESSGVSYSVKSGRFGLACFWNFELTHSQEFVPNEEFHPEDEETEDHQVNTPAIKEISSEPVEENEPTEEATATDDISKPAEAKSDADSTVAEASTPVEEVKPDETQSVEEVQPAEIIQPAEEVLQ